EKEESRWKVERYSQHLACDTCGRSYEPLNPHHYSFNSPLGWCPTCEGLGFQRGANVELLIRNPDLSLRDGAVAAWPEVGKSGRGLRSAEAIAKQAGFSLDTPYRELDPAHQRVILHGTGEAWLRLASGGRKPPVESPRAGDRRKGVADSTGGLRPPLAFQYK